MNPLDLIDIYRILYLRIAEHTFFSSKHKTFPETDHIQGHETNVNKYKRFEIIQGVSLYCILEINNKNETNRRPLHPFPGLAKHGLQ